MVGEAAAPEPEQHHRHVAARRADMADDDEEEKGALLGSNHPGRSVSFAPPKRKKELGLMEVSLLVFFTVSGGPMGSEDAVGAVGPLMAISAYALFPIIYAMPVAMVTGELASLFPEDASYTLWIGEAFGPFWAFQEGYWSLCAGMTNAAMYSIMIVEIIERSSETYYSYPARWTLGATFAACATAPNFMGVRFMGQTLLVFFLCVLVPFVLLTLAAARHADSTHWETGPSARPRRYLREDEVESEDALSGWTMLMSTAFWNYGGVDSASAYAGEVRDPARTYPRALFVSLLIIAAALVIPLLFATLGTSSFHDTAPPYAEWTDGTYVDLALVFGGRPLQAIVAFSGFAAQLAMFSTEMFVDSHLIYGMAQQGLAPRGMLARDPATGAPTVAIAAMLAFVLAGYTFLDRFSLLVMNNTFAGATVLLELAAALKLRDAVAPHDPEVAYRAPCKSRESLALALVPAVAISMYVVTPAVLASSPRVALTTLGILGVGVALGKLAEKRVLAASE